MAERSANDARVYFRLFDTCALRASILENKIIAGDMRQTTRTSSPKVEDPSAEKGGLPAINDGRHHKIPLALEHGVVETRERHEVIVPTTRKMTLRVQNSSGVTITALDTPVVVVTLASSDLKKLGAAAADADSRFPDNLAVARAITALKPDFLSPRDREALSAQLRGVVTAVSPSSTDTFNFVHADRSFERFARLVLNPDACSEQEHLLGSHMCVAVCAAGSNGRFAKIFMPPPGPAGRWICSREVPLNLQPRVTLDTIGSIWYLGSAGWSKEEILGDFSEFGVTKCHIEAVFSGRHERVLGRKLEPVTAGSRSQRLASRLKVRNSLERSGAALPALPRVDDLSA